MPGGLIFGSDEPVIVDGGDNTTYCMGTIFSSDVAGTIPQIHWRCPQSGPGGYNSSVVPVKAQLWQRNISSIIATAEFTPSTTGQWWHELVDWDIEPDLEYIFSVVTDRYTATTAYFTADKINGHITAPFQAGRFSDLGASTSTFYPPLMPNAQFNSGAYFLDIDFVPAASGPSFKVWNGSVEVPATVKLWDGSAEVAVSLSSIT